MNRANSRSEYYNYSYYVFIHDHTSDLVNVIRVNIPYYGVQRYYLPLGIVCVEKYVNNLMITYY